MFKYLLSRVFSGPLLTPTAASFAVLCPVYGFAATTYWDGTGTSWNSAASWSEAPDAPTPDPIAFPGVADIANFVAASATTPQTVNLDADQSVLGISTNSRNNFLTTILAGGTNRRLNLGESGLSHNGGGLTIGSSSVGQQVDIQLLGSQTWTSSSANAAAGAIKILNGVSIVTGGNQTLTLNGTNDGALISGSVSDGNGTLSLNKSGNGSWTLNNTNSYSGLTSVTRGTLRIENGLALGDALNGTTVAESGSIQLANNVTISGETLTLQGPGDPDEFNSGALRSISGNNTWAGNIIISPGLLTRIASDSGNLKISGDITLSPVLSDQLTVHGDGNGEISGIISGASRVTRSAIPGVGTWTFSGMNTYTGKTTINSGILAVSSINSVVGGNPSSNLGAPTTVANGTIDLGHSSTFGAILRYIGPGEVTDRVININNINSSSPATAVLDQSGEGSLIFTSPVISTHPGGGTLRLEGSTSGVGELVGGVSNGPSRVFLIKSGTGMWRLSGSSTYTGTTVVQNGTLIVAGTASGSSATVGSTSNPDLEAILIGGSAAPSATRTLASVSAVTAGAKVDPGITPLDTAVLNTSSFSLTNSAHLIIDIRGLRAGADESGGYDRVNVLDSITSASLSGGVLDLKDLSINPFPRDALLFIVVNNGTGAPSPLFSGVTLDGVTVPDLNKILIGDQQFALVNNANFDQSTGTYGGSPSGGNDIALVAVPEPFSAFALLGGATCLALRHHRRSTDRRAPFQSGTADRRV